MRLLLGLVRPDAGGVSVLGVNAARDAAEVRRRLGYMPELDCLPLEMTARDLVVHMAELRGLPRRDAVLRASEVLFQVGLEEERSRLIRTFSTGMKQRAKLAQALVHSPELVVLDEPTNGLDPSGREEMLALVRRLSSELGIAVLLSSHVLEDVTRTCDAVVVLREGRVVTAGRIDEMEGLAGDGVLVRATGDLEAFAAGSPRAGSRPAPATAAWPWAARPRTPCSTGCATPPPRPASPSASCGRPGPRSRTRSWRRSSELDGAAPRGEDGRGRDPRRPLRDVRRRAARARGGRGVAGALGRAALAGRPARLEGQGRADHAHPAGGRARRDRAGRAGPVRRPDGDRPHRGAALLGLPGDHRRGDPAVRRHHDAGAALPRPARRGAAALLLDRRQPRGVPARAA